jgi:hypothetical protein
MGEIKMKSNKVWFFDKIDLLIKKGTIEAIDSQDLWNYNSYLCGYGNIAHFCVRDEVLGNNCSNKTENQFIVPRTKLGREKLNKMAEDYVWNKILDFHRSLNKLNFIFLENKTATIYKKFSEEIAQEKTANVPKKKKVKKVSISKNSYNKLTQSFAEWQKEHEDNRGIYNEDLIRDDNYFYEKFGWDRPNNRGDIDLVR